MAWLHHAKGIIGMGYQYVLSPVANFLANKAQKYVDDPSTDLDEKAVDANKALALYWANKKLKEYF